MKALRPGDFGQGCAPFGSTVASVLEASFCASVSSSPGWEIEFPIVQNPNGLRKISFLVNGKPFTGLSEEQTSTLTQEGRKEMGFPIVQNQGGLSRALNFSL